MAQNKETVRMAQFGSVLVTRDRARAIREDLPECRSLDLDFKDVGVASPSFLDELLKVAIKRGVTELRFRNTSDATNRNLERLVSLQPLEEGGKKSSRPDLDFPDVQLVG